MYVKVTSELASDIREVKEYFPADYGAPGRKRKKRRNVSPEVIKKQNARIRERRLQELILLNFRGGWNVTLRYREESQPESIEEAKERFRSFRDSMRRTLDKEGIRFKWIVVTEKGSKAHHYHHHLIVESLWEEGIDIRELIRQKWARFGTTYNSKLHDEGNYEKLAVYLLKSSTKEEQKKKNEEEKRQEPVYQVSRGLKTPTIISKETYRGDIKEPEAPKGWYVDIESLIQGINPYTGKKYQRYFIKNTLPRVMEDTETREQENALPKVNIYIESQVKKGQGECIYLMEFITKNGAPVTRHAAAHYKGSKTALTLYALIAGVSRITLPADVKIYSTNPVVANAIKNDWMDKWEKESWVNRKGEAVNCAGLWRYLKKISAPHTLRMAPASEKNTYHRWLVDELEKKAKEIREKEEKERT